MSIQILFWWYFERWNNSDTVLAYVYLYRSCEFRLLSVAQQCGIRSRRTRHCCPTLCTREWTQSKEIYSLTFHKYQTSLAKEKWDLGKLCVSKTRIFGMIEKTCIEKVLNIFYSASWHPNKRWVHHEVQIKRSHCSPALDEEEGVTPALANALHHAYSCLLDFMFLIASK